jgi:hypothetical protein
MDCSRITTVLPSLPAGLGAGGARASSAASPVPAEQSRAALGAGRVDAASLGALPSKAPGMPTPAWRRGSPAPQDLLLPGAGSEVAAAERLPASPRRTAAIAASPAQLPRQQPAARMGAAGASADEQPPAEGAGGHDREDEHSLLAEGGAGERSAGSAVLSAGPLAASAAAAGISRLAGQTVSSATPQEPVEQPAALQQPQEATSARAAPVQPGLSSPAGAGQPAGAALALADLPLPAAAPAAPAAREGAPARHAPNAASSAAGSSHAPAHAGQATEATNQATQSGRSDAAGESTPAASPLQPGADLRSAAPAEPQPCGGSANPHAGTAAALAREASAANVPGQSRAAAALQPADLQEAAHAQHAHSAAAAPLTSGQAAMSLTPVVSEALRGEGVSAGITIRSRRSRASRSAAALVAAADVEQEGHQPSLLQDAALAEGEERTYVSLNPSRCPATKEMLVP